MHHVSAYDGRFPATGGLKLFYQSWTLHAAPTRGAVVLVHGIGEHSGAYGRVVERLVPAGLAVYGFDLRGHGRSPGPRGFVSSWDEYRQDLGAFVRFVQGPHPDLPLFLVGHSMGGIIVLDYALRHPDGLTGVVAISPAIGDIGVSPALMLVTRAISRVRPSFSRRTGLDVAAISRDPQAVEAYRADALVHDLATARLVAEMVRTAKWIQAHAPELSVPLLIQHGNADRIAHPNGSRRFVANVTVPDKELREYPGAFHQVHNDTCHEEVTGDLLAWLERHL